MTTASPKNFEYLKSLGAAYIFDYKQKSFVGEMTTVLRDKDVVGALAVSAGTTADCIDVLAQCRSRKFVASCSSLIPLDALGDTKRITIAMALKLLPAVMRSIARTWWKSHRHGIVTKFYDASSMVDNQIGRYIFQEYLGKALANGSFRPAPPAKVVGAGLRNIQTGFDIQRKGVSASKIIVTLD